MRTSVSLEFYVETHFSEVVPQFTDLKICSLLGESVLKYRACFRSDIATPFLPVPLPQLWFWLFSDVLLPRISGFPGCKLSCSCYKTQFHVTVIIQHSVCGKYSTFQSFLVLLCRSESSQLLLPAYIVNLMVFHVTWTSVGRKMNRVTHTWTRPHSLKKFVYIIHSYE